MCLILVCSLFFLGGCFKKIKQSNKPRIVCTTSMIADVVQELVGDKMTVVWLMGPGVDPHLYRPSEGDIQQLNKANIIFYNGLHLEAKMIPLFKHFQDKKDVVQITKNIPESSLLFPPEYDGLYDPHVWFDLDLWASTVKTMSATLIENDVTNKAFYEQQRDRYLEKLADLTFATVQLVNTIPQQRRILVTAHDAFNYFARQYDFTVKALQGVSTQSEAGIEDVKMLVDYIVKHKIPAIFVESSIPKRHIQAVQEAVKAQGWDVKIGGELFSDALGGPESEAGTYVGMIRHNVETIVAGLQSTAVALHQQK